LSCFPLLLSERCFHWMWRNTPCSDFTDDNYVSSELRNLSTFGVILDFPISNLIWIIRLYTYNFELFLFTYMLFRSHPHVTFILSTPLASSQHSNPQRFALWLLSTSFTLTVCFALWLPPSSLTLTLLDCLQCIHQFEESILKSFSRER